MSIDARITKVEIDDNGKGMLHLIDRPSRRKGDAPGIAGQKILRFLKSPEYVEQLEGKDIWGGANEIMLGDVKIADRDGYTYIKFVDFKEALIDDYNRNTDSN